MLISAHDAPEIAVPEDAVVMRPLVRSSLDQDDLSLTWVRLAGRHRRLRTDRSTRVYYLLDGAASFVVGDEQFAAKAGDVVVVPRSVPYEFWGEMTYLVVNGPAFVEGDDVYDEN